MSATVAIVSQSGISPDHFNIAEICNIIKACGTVTVLKPIQTIVSVCLIILLDDIGLSLSCRQSHCVPEPPESMPA